MLVGTKTSTPIIAMSPNTATIKNVERQPNDWPTMMPRGTPVTKATVNPLNIVAIALADFSSETKLVAITDPTEKKTP